MGGIERRVFMKAATVGGIALSIGGAQCLLASSEAHAQGGSPRAVAWPNRRLLDILKIDHPIIQAPMGGGHISPDMPVAVCESGGLGSFPCSALTSSQLRDVVAKIRAQTTRPLNLNFFCHVTQRDAAVEAAWLKRLAPYYTELGVSPPAFPTSTRPPFGALPRGSNFCSPSCSAQVRERRAYCHQQCANGAARSRFGQSHRPWGGTTRNRCSIFSPARGCACAIAHEVRVSRLRRLQWAIRRTGCGTRSRASRR
jgi:hypothetical protein